jgi:hypothetical protein
MTDALTNLRTVRSIHEAQRATAQSALLSARNANDAASSHRDAMRIVLEQAIDRWEACLQHVDFDPMLARAAAAALTQAEAEYLDSVEQERRCADQLSTAIGQWNASDAACRSANLSIRRAWRQLDRAGQERFAIGMEDLMARRGRTRC